MKKAREKTQTHAMKQATRKESKESTTSSSIPVQTKVDSDKKEKYDIQSQLNKRHIDEVKASESKRQKVEETVEPEQSEQLESSDSSEADWSDYIVCHCFFNKPIFMCFPRNCFRKAGNKKRYEREEDSQEELV